MYWFKHLTRARHDPFIFDLRQTFGPVGYWVYFATLEIYAESYQPAPGWFLNVSIDFMKRELDFYHAAKMTKIFDFIRCWPNQAPGSYQEDTGQVSGAEAVGDLSAISPKWVASLSNGRVMLLIPNFVKIMDEYTKKKARRVGDATGQRPDSGPGEDNRETQIAGIMSEIAQHCEALSALPEKKGRAFPGRAFVGHCIKEGLHPGAIRDGTRYLLDKAGKDLWAEINDPFGMARGVTRTRQQYYEAMPIDLQRVRTIYGEFFSGQ